MYQEFIAGYPGSYVLSEYFRMWLEWFINKEDIELSQFQQSNLRMEIHVLNSLHSKYTLLLLILVSVVSIEDAFDQDHWDAWSALTQKVEIQIVG